MTEIMIKMLTAAALAMLGAEPVPSASPTLTTEQTLTMKQVQRMSVYATLNSLCGLNDGLGEAWPSIARPYYSDDAHMLDDFARIAGKTRIFYASSAEAVQVELCAEEKDVVDGH